MARKPGLGGLLLAGIAAYGAYKYSKMSEQQKRNLKTKGRKVLDEGVGGLKNILGKGQDLASRNGHSYTPQG